MFCIMSKNKNGTESAIAYFDTIEKAENAIPANATQWYVKEIGELKPFLDTLKISNETKYIKYSEPEPVKLEEKKIEVFDTEKALKDHMIKALVVKDNEADKKEVNELEIIKMESLDKKETFIKDDDEEDDDIKRPVIKKNRPRHLSAYSKPIIKNIQPIKHLDPIKKCDYPTEENGVDYFRYSYYFYDIKSTPTLTKTYGNTMYYDKVIVQEGDFYKDKGFNIVLYDVSKENAEKRMKEKLKELKKIWK